jgi:hypothetical protein
VATSTTAVMNLRRRCRCAGCITGSSKPTIATGPTPAGSVTRSPPTRWTADHTVDHDTPKPRAIDAGVPSTAATRSHAQPGALFVNTRRGSANPTRSVQVLTAQTGSGQHQILFRHAPVPAAPQQARPGAGITAPEELRAELRACRSAGS